MKCYQTRIYLLEKEVEVEDGMFTNRDIKDLGQEVENYLSTIGIPIALIPGSPAMRRGSDWSGHHYVVGDSGVTVLIKWVYGWCRSTIDSEEKGMTPQDTLTITVVSPRKESVDEIVERLEQNTRIKEYQPKKKEYEGQPIPFSTEYF